MSRSVRAANPCCSPSFKAGTDFTAQVQRCKIPGCHRPGARRVTEMESVSETPDEPAELIAVDSWLCDEHAKQEARK